ncbi:hypothetical protein [Ectobacillus panaciterrae]|uniref:hypothetical protein n=1 Tax=Ectobacillus panaciterrae TaxID=363872 RepID=UPI0012DCBB30|nr:hypothetical protein [Ectobacillus panaciterrae]
MKLFKVALLDILLSAMLISVCTTISITLTGIKTYGIIVGLLLSSAAWSQTKKLIRKP